MRLRAGVAAAALLAAAGCGSAAPATTTGPGTSAGLLTTTAATTAPAITQIDARFGLAGILVDGRPFRVAVADTAELRARGLMGVTDLGPIDGMLFVYPEPVAARFWMKDTLIPLDVAFFDGDGRLIAVLAMDPCEADPCPDYGPDAAFRWALEAPAGDLAGLPPGALLEFDG